MMKRRIRFGLVCGTLLLVLGFLSTMAYCFCFIRDPIRYENLERLEKGMSKAEVEELLSCPPGDYSTGVGALEFSPHVLLLLSDSTSTWFGDRAEIRIFWDENETYLGLQSWPRRRLGIGDRFERGIQWLFGS